MCHSAMKAGGSPLVVSKASKAARCDAQVTWNAAVSRMIIQFWPTTPWGVIA